MKTIEKSATINDTQKGVRVDFQYFIQSAVNQELSWKTLTFFLTDLTTSPEKSKEVIQILVEELEKWVTKAKNEVNVVLDKKSSVIDIDKEIDLVKDVEDTLEKIEPQNDDLVNLETENDIMCVDENGESDQVEENLEQKAENEPTEHEMESETIVEVPVQTKESDISMSNANGKSQSVHRCETCSKVFAKSIYLKKHTRIHTGEKPLGMLRVATGRVGSGNSKFSTGRVGSGQQI